MSNQKTTPSFYQKIISLTGWELSLVDKENYKKAPTPVQRNTAQDIFLEEKSVTADEIYFSGDHPFIHIKKLRKIDAEAIRNLHAKIWNEGRSPFLAAITPTEMRLYNCYEPPVAKSFDVEQKLEIAKFGDTEADLNELVEFLHQSKIDSGKIWEEKFGLKLNVKNRVDKKLVANLKATRSQLYDNGKGLSLNVVHALLGRSLFALYLEDNRILIPEAFPKKPRGVNSFLDLLTYPNETYELFKTLKEKFNGDLFPISQEELNSVTAYHLNEVKDCFSRVDYKSDQLQFEGEGWKVFRFDFIPIELISSIYEEFMSEEEENEGKTTIRDNGAYYTKPMLVELMLNEVLPWPDENDCNYNFKILDPACGSGIFLVESYRRLIARWKVAHKRRKIDEEALTHILLYSIHGIDKHPEAIKVAAFSLYLTFLSYLEPVEIREEYIRLKRRKLEPLICWSDEKELIERSGKKPGGNLFQINTFEKSDVHQQQFDIIIGNPPWKKDKPEPIVADYIKEHNLPAQIACAYMNFMPSLLAPKGVIALVTTAKVLFNTGEVYEKFRHRIFNSFQVDTVINLAVVRNVMFENTTNPGAVFVYKKQIQEELPKDHVVYCVPKNIETIGNTQVVVIDATEVKYLPLEEVLAPGSRIFKIAMWGSMRDYIFIRRLKKISSIDTITAKREKGTGLHIKERGKDFGNPHLANHTFITSEDIRRYYTTSDGLKKLGDRHLNYRHNNSDVFNPPVILINEGSKEGDFCASYIDFKCAFLKSAYGISAKDKSPEYHKALVVCLNSSLASYYYFLTSSSWGIDKGGRVQNNDAISFPAIVEQMSESAIKQLVTELDAIKVVFMNPQETIKNIESRIDRLIYKELKIGKQEQHLIKDVLANSISLHERYKSNNAESSICVDKEVKSYAEVLATTLNDTLVHGNSSVGVEVLDSGRRELLHIVKIHFDSHKQPGSAWISKVELDKFSKLINSINEHVLSQHSESVYYRKVFRYYKSKKIYLVKPNEKRFWTISEALNDADSILAELINEKN